MQIEAQEEAEIEGIDPDHVAKRVPSRWLSLATAGEKGSVRRGHVMGPGVSAGRGLYCTQYVVCLEAEF